MPEPRVELLSSIEPQVVLERVPTIRVSVPMVAGLDLEQLAVLEDQRLVQMAQPFLPEVTAELVTRLVIRVVAVVGLAELP